MEIVLNNKVEQISSTTIEGMIQELKIDSKGVAIGVNSQVIARSKWETTELQDGDKVVIVSAVFGG